jgi:succinoglycan biosynthesis transport protein ExoP
MADHFLPPSGGSPAPLAPLAGSPLALEQAAPSPTVNASQLERPLAAMRRYKWLMLVVVILCSIGGVVAARIIKPQYEVAARIMIAGDEKANPIKTVELLTSNDWTSLLRTFAIVDAVVVDRKLYLQPQSEADRWLFNNFQLVPSHYAMGRYQLAIDKDSKRWRLSKMPSQVPVDSGGIADSVGRAAGFQWVLPAAAFNGTGIVKPDFTVVSPREASVKLNDRLVTSRPPGSNFLTLTLQDPNPQFAAEILNTWTERFVGVAASLKKQKLVTYRETLGDQLQQAKAALDSAEVNLSAFRITAITKPSEGSAISAGTAETRDPVVKKYFDMKIEYDDLRRDAQLLQGLITSLNKDSVPSEALLEVRAVASGQAVTQSLRNAIAEYHSTEDNIAKQRLVYTDEHPIVKALVSQANELKHNKIPRLANELLQSLRSRASDDSLRIASQEGNLQQIPQRTIEEERLRRARDLASGLYASLQKGYGEAQLAEANATPDVSVLDTAIAPLEPTKNRKSRLVILAVVGGIAAAIGLAILLDVMDGRLRYPEQVTDELGLPIAGTVPNFPKNGVKSPDQMFQIVESFRSLRMAVRQASYGGKVAVAISSPAPSEGKSLISANLAMSFADAGMRTVLVDGDTRRGLLHEMFGMTAEPGLTNYLGIGGLLDDIVRKTSHASLDFVSCGARRRRSPELITSAALPSLLAALQQRYDAVIVDTPPLAAGVDAYAISAAAGNLLLVLRAGKTARRMAAEKLRMFKRLPVNIVGAVLNGAGTDGAYAYYGYTPGYEATDEEEQVVGTGVVKSGSPIMQ